MKTPRAKAEIGPLYKAEFGIAVCKKCNAVYYKKSWHHGTDVLTSDEARRLKLKSVLCPADQMIKEGLYEGELSIKNVPIESETKLFNLIRTYGERSYDRDCQHRVIAALKQGKGSVRVTTTENQLVAKLAKKIKDTFKASPLKITYSREPYEVERIRMEFIRLRRKPRV